MDYIQEISNTYDQVIKKLIAGKRPLITLNEDLVFGLNKHWLNSIEVKDNKEISKILCILDNTVTLSPVFTDVITKTIQDYHDEEIIILALGVSRRQVIDLAHQRGERVNYEFIMLLKRLLTHRNPEVLEWSLRLIESLGNQAILVKEDVLKASPGIMALFNSHKKASKQIIELLNKRWERK